MQKGLIAEKKYYLIIYNMPVLEIISLTVNIVAFVSVVTKIIHEKTIQSSCNIRDDNEVVASELTKQITELKQIIELEQERNNKTDLP